MGAIWGYTQLLLDKDARKLLIICTRSGLYDWLRMPLGPAPAPAETQSYVSGKFGSLRNKHRKEFASPCMGDLEISSATFEDHVEEFEILMKKWKRPNG